jgi:leucyl aminopeptidase
MMKFATDAGEAKLLTLVRKEAIEDWKASLSATDRTWADQSGFIARLGDVLLFPNPDGSLREAVGGLGSTTDHARGRFLIASIAAKLPKGVWKLPSDLDDDTAEEAALAWLLSQYRFGTYRAAPSHGAQLIAPDGIDADRVEAIAEGEALTRDLINTPALDMGPDELEIASRALADRFGASINVVSGDALATDFPMIHAVGMASPRAPRLIDMRWGASGPNLTLVGKGVCFDTGGLNLKPGASMGLMKKDMGGAANVLGLAHMIMALGMPVQLRVLVPAVENSVSGIAFRPGDILTSRKGLTVEINNTDAEGRLVLADALTLADETPPDLMISMATLTGAARVAVGPDLAPFYTDHDPDAAALEMAANRVQDPVWRMPFWTPYEPMIEPGIADLDNAPKGGFAGSITAALFLKRFVTETPRYMHFDVYGWTPSAAPGRPKGGVGQGIRALVDAMPEMLNAG